MLPVRACARGRALFVVCVALIGAWSAPAWGAGFLVSPPSLTLEGNFARAQLVITALGAEGAVDERSADLTSAAAYASSDPQVVTVDAAGGLSATGNGEATVQVSHAGQMQAVTVKVAGIEPQPKIGFLHQVEPILSKAGCNAGACHASQYGKGGFKLSVFGFNPDEDYAAIVRDRQGRRVSRIEPEKSLFLLKPTLAVSHGGNRRFQPDDVDYKILHAWLAAEATGGQPARPDKQDAKVTAIEVFPPRRVGTAGFTQQYRVVATYADAKQRDVTHWAKFDSLDDGIMTVSSRGLATLQGRGQAPLMVRFDGQAAIAALVAPYADGQVDLAGWVDQNFVDKLAAAKFRELGIVPSGLCDDATFVRRAYFDAIGTLPTAAEAAAFLDSTEPDKRTKLVDRLLGLTGDPAQDIYGNQYASYWALKWSDLLRSSASTIGEQGMWALHNWLQSSFRENKPYDRFVREIVTAKGSAFSNGPANFYRANGGTTDLAEATAQLFLGVRLQCAKCHHHPFEKYGQEDYYSFAAFFARVGNKGSQEFGLFGGETIVVVRAGGEMTHPKTGQVLPPTPLEGQPAAETPDRRVALASWMTAPDNKFFARNVANRYADYLLGRGLVEPVDDLRATNPASNPELLAALAADFVANGFNLKKLVRTIMTSRLYQLDSQPMPGNAADLQFYSHYAVKRIAAEPLLDAIDRATDAPTKFRNLPLGTRAIDLPDAEYPDYFLKTFGKPRRASVCECERVSTANLAQALHTLNGELLATKIADGKGRVATLLASAKPFADAVNELFLATWSRRATAEELAELQKFRDESTDAKTFFEDLLWTLVNSKQFLYVR